VRKQDLLKQASLKQASVKQGWPRSWPFKLPLALAWLLVMLLARPAWAEPVELHWQYLMDQDFSLEELVLEPHPWQTPDSQPPNMGFRFERHWFRADVELDSLAPGVWDLWIRNAILTDVKAFLIQDDRVAGVLEPLDMHNPVYSFRVEPGSSYQIYLRVQSDTALQLPTLLMPEQEFLVVKEKQDSILGLFVGVMLAMMLYNLILYLSVRDKTFLLYVGHACAFLFFVFSWQGLGGTYIWSGYPEFQHMSVALATFLVIVFSTWFCGDFLRIKRTNFRFTRVFWAVRNLGAVGLVVTPFVPYHWAIFAGSAMSFLAVLVVIGAMVARVTLSNRPARLFMLGWMMYVSGAVVLGLNKFGLIRVNLLTENLILWGAVFDMILLCIALGDKFHEERNLKIRAQELAIKAVRRERNAKELAVNKQTQARLALEMAADAQREYAQLLERRVLERTQELQRTQVDLENISVQDALTKLKNRRYLLDRLQQELSHCSRNGKPFAIIMVDIDHFKQVNDTYGHLAGDECIRSVGRLMQEKLRSELDIVCRYGGEEFVLILPNTREGEAMFVADKLRAHVAQTPILCDSQRIMVTISVGVRIVEPNAVPDHADSVIEQADQALYQAKSQGRNCVCLA